MLVVGRRRRRRVERMWYILDMFGGILEEWYMASFPVPSWGIEYMRSARISPQVFESVG
jgi:hypothetical protein